MRLIDADELQERLAQMRIGDLLSIGEYETLSRIVTMQATADRNHGKWIKRKWHNEILDTEFNGVSCSVCGELINQDTLYENNFNYCPSCGSKNKE